MNMPTAEDDDNKPRRIPKWEIDSIFKKLLTAAEVDFSSVEEEETNQPGTLKTKVRKEILTKDQIDSRVQNILGFLFVGSLIFSTLLPTLVAFGLAFTLSIFCYVLFLGRHFSKNHPRNIKFFTAFFIISLIYISLA
jgi:hypothetical protein